MLSPNQARYWPFHNSIAAPDPLQNGMQVFGKLDSRVLRAGEEASYSCVVEHRKIREKLPRGAGFTA